MNERTNTGFQEALRKAMRDRGITAYGLSHLLCSHGVQVTPQTIYNWTGGKASPSLGDAAAVCRAVGIELNFTEARQ
jgi:DNA-binding XRE family transcriptional regulator